jgi:hypothetical protein
LRRGGVARAIRKTQPPERHYRLAVLFGVGRRRRQVQGIDDGGGPVRGDFRGEVGPAGNVVHDENISARGLRRVFYFHGDSVPLAFKHRIPQLGAEPLQRRHVDVVLLHPRKMCQDQLIIVGVEQISGLTVAQIGATRLMGIDELAHVGPQFKFLVARGRLRAGRPMHPPHAARGGTVAPAGEPPLIANHQFPRQIAGRTGGRERLSGGKGSAQNHRQDVFFQCRKSRTIYPKTSSDFSQLRIHQKAQKTVQHNVCLENDGNIADLGLAQK